MPVTLGPANDLFFLSFDQFGSHLHPYIEPPVSLAPPVPDNTPQPDFGVATFERIQQRDVDDHRRADHQQRPCMTLYISAQQSLPSQPQIAAFLPSHQTAISQLAGAYCGQLLVNDATLRPKLLRQRPGGRPRHAALRLILLRRPATAPIVENALATHAVGSGVTPAPRLR